MVGGRRWGRRAALVAASVACALFAPAAARAFTIVGTQSGPVWWSPDTVAYFDPGEVWSVSDWYGTTTLSGVGGTLAFSSLHEGLWNLQSNPTPSTTQYFSFGLDFTAPVSGGLSCHVSASGWCTSGFTINPLPTDPLAPSADHSSGVDHSELSVNGGPWSAFNPASPTAVQGQNTIQWRAVDIAGNVESAHTATLRLDTQGPAPNISLSGPLGTNGWYTGPVTVTMAPSDPSPGSGVGSTQYYIADWHGTDALAPYTAPFVVSSEGNDYVDGAVTDVAGNEADFSKEIDIDSTPPVPGLTVLTGPTYQDWYKDTVVVHVYAQDYSVGVPSGIDHALIGWTASGLGYAPLNTDLTIHGFGPTPVQYTAVDKAGNVAPVQTQVLKIDGDPPLTQLTFSGATYNYATGWWIGGPLVVSADGTDPNGSGVATMNVCLDGFCGPYFGSHYATYPLGFGTHTISAVSTDNVGHVEAPASWNQATFRVDPTPPTGNLVVTGTPGQNGWYVSPVDLTIVNAFDGGSGLAADPFHYQLFHGARTSFNGTYHDATEGPLTFDADIADAAGNVTQLPEQNIRIDTQPPDVTLYTSVFPGDAGWSRLVSLNSLSATDPFPGSGPQAPQFSVDGGPWQDQSVISSQDGDYYLPDGTHTVDYRVSDYAGHTTQKSQSFTIDQTPPDVTCTLHAPSTWPTDGSLVPVSVDVSVADALSGPDGFTFLGMYSNVDNDPIAAGEAAGWDVGAADTSGQVAALPGRTYTLVFDGKDVAGNDGTCAVEVTVPGATGAALMSGNVTLPDGSAAQIDVRRDATGTLSGAGVSFQGAGLDVQSATIDDAELLGSNGYVAGTLADGSRFTLLLHDGGTGGGDSFRLILPDVGYDSGVLAPATGDIVVTQNTTPPDTTPPVLKLPRPITVQATGPHGAVVTYAATATDDRDHNPSVSCSPASGSTFPLGRTTVACTATDASGNAAHGSFGVTVVDTIAPRVNAALVPLRGRGNDDRYTVQWTCTDAVGVVSQAADIDLVRVTNGQVVELDHAWSPIRSKIGKDGVLVIQAPLFIVVVTCRDAAGNTGIDAALR